MSENLAADCAKLYHLIFVKMEHDEDKGLDFVKIADIWLGRVPVGRG